MLSFPLALLSLLPLINAQSTVSIFMPEAGPSQALVASIVSADATATTYSINCANATTISFSSSSLPASAFASASGSSSECGFGPDGVTHIQGPSTIGYTYSYDTFTAVASCQLTGTTRAVCTASSNLPAESDTRINMGATLSDSASAPARTAGPSVSTLSDGRQVATLEASDLEGAFLPVVVTAGQQKAMGGTGSTSTPTGSMAAKSTATWGTATGGTATGSAAPQKATGAAGRMSVEGLVGSIGALAVGAVAAML